MGSPAIRATHSKRCIDVTENLRPPPCSKTFISAASTWCFLLFSFAWNFCTLEKIKLNLTVIFFFLFKCQCGYANERFRNRVKVAPIFPFLCSCVPKTLPKYYRSLSSKLSKAISQYDLDFYASVINKYRPRQNMLQFVFICYLCTVLSGPVVILD